jgi:hypothetical protein
LTAIAVPELLNFKNMIFGNKIIWQEKRGLAMQAPSPSNSHT